MDKITFGLRQMHKVTYVPYIRSSANLPLNRLFNKVV